MELTQKYTINCNGKLIDFSTPKVMGILNITPDSFFDGGLNNTLDSALAQTQKMLDHGATFIDIGGYSSRPGATNISPREEAERVVPIIKAINTSFPDALISIDTFRATVAQQAVHAGACIVNDISAGSLDQTMFKTVGKLGVPYIMMHMRGTPRTMQTQTKYANLLLEIRQYFSGKTVQAYAAGINDIIIDPGFGFAKTIDQNFEILQALSSFKMLDAPILAGLSRKSMIYKTLNTTPDKALNGTTFLNAIALQRGANILRVHDVKQAVECVTLHLALNKADP